MSDHTLDELCAAACAEAFRGDGEILASPIGTSPTLGARLAKATFSPELLMTDGVASLVANVMPFGVADAPKVVEGYLPYRAIFDLVAWGRRHVMMGASQLDRFGNQNIAAIGDFAKPKAELLGMRGAPGNTLNHATSFWIPRHTARVFVERVDVVSGVGFDRARTLGRSGRFHGLRRVVTNLAVLDFETPDHAMRLRSIHPGVSVDDVLKATGFSLIVPPDLGETRAPSPDELRLLRERIDPTGAGKRELS